MAEVMDSRQSGCGHYSCSVSIQITKYSCGCVEVSVDPGESPCDDCQDRIEENQSCGQSGSADCHKG